MLGVVRRDDRTTCEHVFRVVVVDCAVLETLPANDRTALAEALIASLDEHLDEDAKTAWKGEIERRTNELDAGVVSPIPWPKV